MQIARPLDRFHQLQAVVLSLLNRVRPFFNGKDPGVWPLLVPYRSELTNALHELQIYKHREIFEPILSGTGPSKALVTRLKIECVQVGVDYQAYTQKWDSADITENWHEYRLAALSMMRHLRESLARQDDAIRLLYAQPGPHVR